MLLWMPFVLLGVAAFTAGTIKPTQGLIHERESAYNFIQVVERRGTLLVTQRRARASLGLQPNSTDHQWNVGLFFGCAIFQHAAS